MQITVQPDTPPGPGPLHSMANSSPPTSVTRSARLAGGVAFVGSSSAADVYVDDSRARPARNPLFADADAAASRMPSS
ncbi:MAG: hypothetical protein R3F11_10280 [Verrucomicrobiales bacterium]